MPLKELLKKVEHLEIQEYKKPQDYKKLRDTHVSFSGSPYNHPYDEDKVILVSDPFSTNTCYFEFKVEDIDFLEELSNIVTLDKIVIPMVRVWVKIGSIAIRSTPFKVSNIL